MNENLQHLPGVLLGELCGVAADGAPLVRSDRSPEPRAALVAVEPRDWRRHRGAPVVLVFVDGDPGRPVLLGLVTPPGAPAAEPRTLRVAAGEELRIECGKSSIRLRADGRIEIRGDHVLSRSRGANKIQGGSVHLN
ncbi:MAG: DUF6484 domain-containing protein [Planctomycetota bacterium]